MTNSNASKESSNAAALAKARHQSALLEWASKHPYLTFYVATSAIEAVGAIGTAIFAAAPRVTLIVAAEDVIMDALVAPPTKEAVKNAFSVSDALGFVAGSLGKLVK